MYFIFFILYIQIVYFVYPLLIFYVSKKFFFVYLNDFFCVSNWIHDLFGYTIFLTDIVTDERIKIGYFIAKNYYYMAAKY